MAFLSKNQIKDIIQSALKEVADFTGDIENYNFNHFKEYHKKLFVTKIKELIMKSPYYDRNGNSSTDRYYDVPFSNSTVNSWRTLDDCINYTFNNQMVRQR
jgi:hypothetical protein